MPPWRGKRGGGFAATASPWQAPGFCSAMILALLLGPLIWPVPINAIDFAAQLQGPSLCSSAWYR